MLLDEVLCTRRNTVTEGQGNHSTPALESYERCSGKNLALGFCVTTFF